MSTSLVKPGRLDAFMGDVASRVIKMQSRDIPGMLGAGETHTAAEWDQLIAETRSINDRRSQIEAAKAARGNRTSRTAAVRMSAGTRQPTLQERAASHGLTVDEMVAVGEVAKHINAYKQDKQALPTMDISLRDFVCSELVSTGEVKMDMGCKDPLARYKPDLASALSKLEGRV